MPAKKNKCATCGLMFMPIWDTKTVTQLVCSNHCCVLYYDSLKKKGRKVARVVARMVGKRSMAEVKFTAYQLDDNKDITYKYEPDVFTYKVEEIRKYTPDFWIKKIVPKTRKPFYVEYKGVLDARSRKILKLMKAQYPKLDLRLIFENASNKISKVSKTTYAKWAKQHGYQWANNELPEEWIK